ncbi:transposase [Streptomyces sp. GDS52]|uniref:transposase n=1 Tax=Streptomyces sp. GDS52 TaxID=3406419 RepID=UPI003FD01DB0
MSLVQGTRIEPLLPGRTPRRGGRRRDHREVIDAIAFEFRTGTQRVHSPEEYGDSRRHRHAAGARRRGPRPAHRPVMHGRRRPVRPRPRRRGRARRPRCSRAGGRWTRCRG